MEKIKNLIAHAGAYVFGAALVMFLIPVLFAFSVMRFFEWCLDKVEVDARY